MSESAQTTTGVPVGPRATLGSLLTPNPAMWARALRVIPRVSLAEWQRLDLVSRWLIATRSAVLVITLLPCLIAGVLAARDRAFDLGLWLAVTVGLMLAHATNNLLNDLTDHVKGVDRDNYFRARYGPQPLEHGLMTIRQSIGYIVVTGAGALAIGLWLLDVRGGITLQLLLAGVFFVLFYTWPLKYIGLGEIAVIVVWGPLILGGSYFIVTGVWDWNVALLSLVYALGATSVIFGKHVDKLEEDRVKGIRTLPVLLGERNSRWAVVAMMVVPYLICLGLVVSRYTSPLLLVVLLALPKLRQSLKVFRSPRPEGPPEGYPQDAWPLWFVSFAFVHNRAFGSLFLLGLIGDLIVTRI